jgi:hypothetical protein
MNINKYKFCMEYEYTLPATPMLKSTKHYESEYFINDSDMLRWFADLKEDVTVSNIKLYHFEICTVNRTSYEINRW